MPVYQVTAKFDESLVDLLANSNITGLSIERNVKPVMCIELGITCVESAKCDCIGLQVGERTILDLPQDYAKDFTAKMLIRPTGHSTGCFIAIFPKQLEIETIDVSVVVKNHWMFTIKNNHYTVKCGDVLEERNKE